MIDPYANADQRKVGMRNDSRVYDVIRSYSRPITIREIRAEIPQVVEKTIRRAVSTLVAKGFIAEAGRDNVGAKLYIPAGSATHNASERRIPLGGDLLKTKDFVNLMASMEADPFSSRLKLELLTDEARRFLRQRMLFVMISAGEAGLNNQLEKAQENMVKVLEEMERLTSMVRGFLNGAVWYEQYRDAIALDMRELQKENPGLYQLAMDYVKSGA